MQTETTARLTTLTPTETRLMSVLQDGERHRKSELFEVMDLVGDKADHFTLYNHIKNMRPKIAGRGLLILFESWGRYGFYRLVRHVHSAYEQST